MTQDSNPGWFIVSQVKSNRVVYFTDDPAYQPAMEGDWYFVTHHPAALPSQMTLRNCWGWRFNGSVFTDVRVPEGPAVVLSSLMESNRKALLSLLREKIDRLRAEWAPMCTSGEHVRQAKLDEARRFQATAQAELRDAGELAFLSAAAEARNITLAEAARQVLARDADMRTALLTTERLRERFCEAIRVAQTQQDLIDVRQQLLGELDLRLLTRFPEGSDPMKPEDWSAPLSEVHRAHEVARLRAQLRQLVNASRARVHQGYEGGETLLKQKAKLAQALLSNGGRKPDGIDFTLLQTYADAHHMNLEDAARLALGAVNEAEAILVSTELLKDRLSARIEAVSTLRDVKTIGQELGDVARNRRSVAVP